MNKRRVFYDTEFLEDGHTIELISIGMIDDQGETYYAVNADAPMDRIREHPWLMDNVVPHLPMVNPIEPGSSLNRAIVDLNKRDPLVKPKWVIRNEIRAWLFSGVDELELWAYYGAYDHVVLSQFWGRMIDLPGGIPMYTNDLMTLWALAGRPAKPKQSETEHHALADAKWNRQLFEVCSAWKLAL